MKSGHQIHNSVKLPRVEMSHKSDGCEIKQNDSNQGFCSSHFIKWKEHKFPILLLYKSGIFTLCQDKTQQSLIPPF